jgi:hypothetical protein
MRNVLTHLYDIIDLERVIEAAEPTLAIYGRYSEWVRGRLLLPSGQPDEPDTESASDVAHPKPESAP